MATLSNLSAFYSLSSHHKLFSSHLPSLHHELLNCPYNNHPRIYASATKKPRASRRVKSNAELFNDIKEFLSTVGLPQDHVPSMKELSEYGRQDLANIVRRRGYKFLRQLLATWAEPQISGSSTEESLTGVQDSYCEGQHEKVEDASDETFPKGQHEKVEDASDDISLSTEATKVKEHEENLAQDASMSSEATKVKVDIIEFAEDVSFSLGAAGANVLEDDVTRAEINSKLDMDEHICSGPESSIYPSLQKKVAKFIQDGELDNVEDNGFEFLKERTSEDSEEITESRNAMKSMSASTPGAQNDFLLYDAELLNGNFASSSDQIEHPVLGVDSSRIESHSTEEATMVDLNEDLELEAQKVENQTEINRLKFMLHQKELELTHLKEQIEKDKLALSNLQSKADKEISKAQKLILEKDSELQAAEESLSELKEVEIQYWGEGDVVEVAGSFNGWHQMIKMDSQPSSSISDPLGSRKSRLWRTVLWLYPGVYEIKFIVDGHWTVDSQRESVTRGTIHNNILRVVR